MGFLCITYCENDNVIPSSHAKQIILNLNARSLIYKGGHGDVLNGDLFVNHLKQFIDKCDDWNKTLNEISIESDIELQSFEENNQSYKLLQE